MAMAPHCPPYEHFPEVARALAVNPLLCETPHRGVASLSDAHSCMILALHRCLISSADTQLTGVSPPVLASWRFMYASTDTR